MFDKIIEFIFQFLLGFKREKLLAAHALVVELFQFLLGFKSLREAITGASGAYLSIPFRIQAEVIILRPTDPRIRFQFLLGFKWKKEIFGVDKK